MGQIAEEMCSGEVCRICNLPLEGGAVGYERTCIECGGDTKLHPDLRDDEESEADRGE